MIFDVTTLFSSAQAITATAASTNTIDLGATGTVYGAASAYVRDIGPGRPVPIRIAVVQTFATLTSLTVTLETDDNTGFSSALVAWTSGAVLAATLVAGYVFNLEFLPRRTNERYLRLNYTVGGSNATAGQITAGINMGGQTNG